MIPAWYIVGHTLRSIRRERGISVVEAAKRYHVSVVDIAVLEQGGRCPGIDIMEYLDTVLEPTEAERESITRAMGRGVE